MQNTTQAKVVLTVALFVGRKLYAKIIFVVSDITFCELISFKIVSIR